MRWTPRLAFCAWLADRYAIDLTALVTFTSRGSNRWKRGAEVTTDPVAGHRDMSLTACPGDALYPLVRTQLVAGRPRFPAGRGDAHAHPAADAIPDAGQHSRGRSSRCDGHGSGVDRGRCWRRCARRRRGGVGDPAALSRREQPDRERQPAAEEGADEPDEEPSDGQ